LWHLDRQIRTQPDAWLAYVLRTKAQIQLAQFDRASADFDKAIQLDSSGQVLLWYRSFAVESADKAQWQAAFWYLDRLIAARPQEPVFYGDRGRAHLKRNQWKEAVKDYEEAVQRNTKDPQIWREKGRLDIDQGRWPEAARAWDRTFELDPSDHWAWYQSAPLHLYLGDVDGYRRRCREMLRRVGQTDNPMIAERTAKVCLLRPDAVADPKVVQQLAQRTVTGTEKYPYYGWFQLAKGMAEYRAGHWEQAIHWLEESQKRPYSSQGPSKALAGLFLSMAHERLGQADEVRQALRQAKALIDAELQRWKADDADQINEDWLKAVIVRAEAEALVEGKRAEPVK
jgi:tetratricopeptide (TPR) repeat protein